jgi:hypothetical protein
MNTHEVTEFYKYVVGVLDTKWHGNFNSRVNITNFDINSKDYDNALIEITFHRLKYTSRDAIQLRIFYIRAISNISYTLRVNGTDVATIAHEPESLGLEAFTIEVVNYLVKEYLKQLNNSIKNIKDVFKLWEI